MFLFPVSAALEMVGPLRRCVALLWGGLYARRALVSGVGGDAGRLFTRGVGGGDVAFAPFWHHPPPRLAATGPRRATPRGGRRGMEGGGGGGGHRHSTLPAVDVRKVRYV